MKKSYATQQLSFHRNMLFLMVSAPIVVFLLVGVVFTYSFNRNSIDAAGTGWNQNSSQVPIAAGTSAANMNLRSGVWVMERWVARHTGTIKTLHLHINSEGANCDQRRTGYGKGDGGRWYSTTHYVLSDGRPDMSRTLAVQDFLPCSSSPLIDRKNGVAYLPMNFQVSKGQEFATVIRNIGNDPNNNFISTNHLYSHDGLYGAQARNERNSNASDAYYGLDPREIVGYSTTSGSSWSLPGGQYGPNGGKAFLPTHIQEYTDGFKGGQHYYYALPVPSGGSGETGSKTMVYQNIPTTWQISQLGAYSNVSTSGTLTLYVNGQNRGSVNVSGTGMLRGNLPGSVQVNPGSTVKVTSSGIHLRRIIADNTWATIMGLGTSYKWYLEGNSQQAVPIYPIIKTNSTTTSPTPPQPAPTPAPASPAPSAAPSPSPNAGCTTSGATYEEASTKFNQQCANYIQTRDCDPVNGTWICSSSQIGSGAPSGSPDTSSSVLPPPPITVPEASPINPVPIPIELPIQNDGSIIADFNGDGLNEKAVDKNNDGYIDPRSEVVEDSISNPSLTDSSLEPVTPKAYKEISERSIATGNTPYFERINSNSITFKAGPLPETTIPKPVAYSFFVVGGLSLGGISIYLFISKLSLFAGLRGRIGL